MPKKYRFRKVFTCHDKLDVVFLAVIMLDMIFDAIFMLTDSNFKRFVFFTSSLRFTSWRAFIPEFKLILPVISIVSLTSIGLLMLIFKASKL